MLFDLTNKSTFEECKSWANEVRHVAKKVIIVGNKIDHNENRVIEKSMVDNFVKENDFSYFEISAKYNIGLDSLFKSLESDSKQE